MSDQQRLDTLFNLVEKILIFLGRPGVQMQLVGIAIAVLLAGILSRILWSLTKRFFPSWDDVDLNDMRQVYQQRLFVSVDYLIFPVLNIIAITLTRNLLVAMGGFVGLLTTFNSLFWAFLIYRFFLVFIYVLFPFDLVRRYHLRLLTPLFVLFVIGRVLGELTDLGVLAQVVVTSLFGSPITLGALFLATVGLYLWLDAAWGLQDILFRVITDRTQADSGAVEATLTLGRYILITIGIIIIVSNLNFDTTTIAAITGGLSVGIGFALREVLSNFISGIFLLFEGSLHPGDVVDVNGEISVVKRLSIRSTRVQTRNNVEVVIPNQTFFTSAFTTYTGTDRIVRVMIPMGAGYNSDPEAVIQVLEEVGQAHPEVRTTPAPKAFLTNFGDSSIDFKLAVWVSDPLRIAPVTSELNRAIWKAFAENDIEIPFPQQDLHVRSGVPWDRLGNDHVVPQEKSVGT